jgi:hypothetical protein
LAEHVSSGTYTTGEEDACKRTCLSWKGWGAAPWLIERLYAFGCTYPTTIQINAIERSVITILVSFQDEEDDDIMLEEQMQLSFSKDNRLWEWSFRGVKTLAYLVPLLSALSETLFVRQKIRVQAEEDVGGSGATSFQSNIAGAIVNKWDYVFILAILRSFCRKSTFNNNSSLYPLPSNTKVVLNNFRAKRINGYKFL